MLLRVSEEYVSRKLKYLKKAEKLGSVEVIEDFRILEALIKSFSFFMDNGLNKNGKVLEETQAGSNLDTVKTTLRGLR